MFLLIGSDCQAMKICVDLDGVICELRKPDQSYAEVRPIPGAVEKLRALHAAGLNRKENK